MTDRKIECRVIPPEADAEFVAGMEQTLDTYALPYDPAFPVLCMDEQPVQLLKETRTPIPATTGHGKRVDYEYERAGTADIFMFTEALAGGREVAVRATKTKADRAAEIARVLEGRHAGCQKIILVCDNLNTHTKGASDEVFEPERARRLARRTEFRHTPKHGSRLNIAENELSSLARRCGCSTGSSATGSAGYRRPGRRNDSNPAMAVRLLRRWSGRRVPTEVRPLKFTIGLDQIGMLRH